MMRGNNQPCADRFKKLLGGTVLMRQAAATAAHLLRAYVRRDSIVVLRTLYFISPFFKKGSLKILQFQGSPMMNFVSEGMKRKEGSMRVAQQHKQHTRLLRKSLEDKVVLQVPTLWTL